MFSTNNKVPLIKESTPSDVPFCCPMCEQVISNSLDTATYLDVGVCRDCEDDFVDGHRQEWIEDGWRPPQEVIIEKIKLRTKKLS